YGAVLPWPKRAGGRASRVAGAQVVLLNGDPALFVERGGKTLVPLREPEEDWLRGALAALVEHVKRGRGKRLAVGRFAGVAATESAVPPLLVEAGFLAGPRRAVLRPERAAGATRREHRSRRRRGTRLRRGGLPRRVARGFRVTRPDIDVHVSRA